MISFFIFFTIFLIAVEIYSYHNGLKKITYDVQPSQTLLEPDEKFKVNTIVENHKLWFLPYLHLIEAFPQNIQIPGEEKNITEEGITYSLSSQLSTNSFAKMSSAKLNSSFYMMPYQRLTRTLEASLPNRGRYLFSGCYLNGGDFLGIKDGATEFTTHKEVVVMPRSLPSPDFDSFLGGLIGDVSIRRFIYEDPMLTIGFSDYTGREPMRDISWTQSARLGKMMVKNYDHTTDICISVILNVQSALNTQEEDVLVEQCFSLTRSLCEQLEKKHIKYSFVTNAIPMGMLDLVSSVEQGLGNVHFYTIMEILGRASLSACENFSVTLRRACRTCEQGQYFIVISPNENEIWKEAYDKLVDISGNKTFLITPELLKKQENGEAIA